MIIKSRQVNYIRQQMEQRIEVHLNEEIETRLFSCLHVAAVLGSLMLVKFFLDCQVNINISNDKRETPLMLAVRYGHLGVAKHLIHNKAYIDKNALYMAVQSRKKDVVDLILNHEHFKKYNFVNKLYEDKNMTPLTSTIDNGDHEIFELLLKTEKADIYSPRPSDEATPLHIAVKTIGSQGAAKIVKRIIASSMKTEKDKNKCDRKDRTGNTPLIYAAKHHNYDMVSELLKTNPNIYHKNHKGNDVWHFALSSKKSSELVTALTKYCREERKETSIKHIPPSIMLTERWGPKSVCDDSTMNIVLQPEIIKEETDDRGNNCLHLAARDRKHIIIKEFIRVCNSTTTDKTVLNNVINATNNDGCTPLHHASQSGSDTIISILIANGANVSGKTSTKSKKMPIHIAASSKYTTINGIRILVQQMEPSDLKSRDGKGSNALGLACSFGFPEIVWELRDLPITNEDETGCTPLHNAADLKDSSVLKKVLEIYELQNTRYKQIDLNQQNKKKETVLHLASKPGFENEIEFLIENGATLDIGDSAGNTILHRLVAEVAESSGERTHQLMKLVQIILDKCVCYSGPKNNYPYDADDTALTQKDKLNEIIRLTQEVLNNSNLSVLALAFKCGAVPVIEFVMNISDVMSFKDERGHFVHYDITNVMKTTIKSDNDHSQNQIPYIELVSALKCKPERMLNILDIQPIRAIGVDDMYIRICKWTLSLLLILHILYMSVFSYIGVTIAEKLLNTTAVSNTDKSFILAYVIVPIEPLICVVVIMFYAHS